MSPQNSFTEDWLVQVQHQQKLKQGATGTRGPLTANAGQTGEILTTAGWSAARPRKYRNTPTVMDGLTFDSAKEAGRYQALKLLERVGAIRELVCQPRFELIACNGEIIGHFKPDFSYFSVEIGRMVAEDVKSPVTRRETAYRLRKKLFEATHGIILSEI